VLHLFRRHYPPCTYRSRRYRRCKCPIWVQGSLRGEWVKKSLNLTSWEAASDLVNAWTAAGEIGVVKPDAPTVKEAVASFFEDATARKLKDATIGKYKVLLEKQLLPWCQTRGYVRLKQLGVDELTKFRASWADGPLSMRKKQERLAAFFHFCRMREWVKSNPVLSIKLPEASQSPTLPFTRDEVKSIVEAADAYPTRNSFGHDNRARVKAFVLLLRHSGLRIRDVVCMKRDRISDDGKLFLYTQKTGTPVWLPLPPGALEAVRSIKNGSSDFFFWTGRGLEKSAVADWQRTLRRLFKLANVEEGHAHRMRDTFAVELLLVGVPIETVSILLGHGSVKITERHYAPWVQARQHKLEEAVRKAWM
jgi:site-specific recombinase XerD